MKLDKTFKAAFKFAAQFAKGGLIPVLDSVLVVPKGNTLQRTGYDKWQMQNAWRQKYRTENTRRP